MRCPSAGSSVRLMLEEATGSSARIGALVPAAGATVEGVQLRVLRNGQPVAFGVPWDHDPRQDGNNTIRVEAQYIRTDGTARRGAADRRLCLKRSGPPCLASRGAFSPARAAPCLD